MVTTAAASSEMRLAPRVIAGRPGRVRLQEKESTFLCGVVDISLTGCRVTLSRKHLPQNWVWQSGMRCDLVISIGPLAAADMRQEVSIHSEIVWSQRTQEGFDILGLRFDEEGSEEVRTIDQFVIMRLRTGLQENPCVQKPMDAEQLDSLSVPLEVEARRPIHVEKTPFRFRIELIGAKRFRAVYAYREREPYLVPSMGETLDVSVFPPSWARGQLRALRFAAKVIAVTLDGVELEFFASGNDLHQMICALIPPKVERQKKAVKVDVSYVLLLLAALVIVLYIMSRSPNELEDLNSFSDAPHSAPSSHP